MAKYLNGLLPHQVNRLGVIVTDYHSLFSSKKSTKKTHVVGQQSLLMINHIPPKGKKLRNVSIFLGQLINRTQDKRENVHVNPNCYQELLRT